MEELYYFAVLERKNIWSIWTDNLSFAKGMVRETAREHGECDLLAYRGDDCVEITSYAWQDGKLVHLYTIKDD